MHMPSKLVVQSQIRDIEYLLVSGSNDCLHGTTRLKGFKLVLHFALFLSTLITFSRNITTTFHDFKAKFAVMICMVDTSKKHAGWWITHSMMPSHEFKVAQENSSLSFLDKYARVYCTLNGALFQQQWKGRFTGIHCKTCNYPGGNM